MHLASDPARASDKSSTADAAELSRLKRFLLCVGVIPALSVPILLVSALLLAFGLILPIQTYSNGKPLPVITVWLFSVCPPSLEGAFPWTLLTASITPYLMLYWLLRRPASVGWAGVRFAGWAAVVLSMDVVFICFMALGFTAPFWSHIVGMRLR